MSKNIENEKCTGVENFDTVKNNNEAAAAKQKLDADESNGLNQIPGGVDKLLRLPAAVLPFSPWAVQRGTRAFAKGSIP